jgi:pimeloyl-ACP methyl ester carboxylesterase
MMSARRVSRGAGPEERSVKIRTHWRSAVDPVWGGLRAAREGYIPQSWSAEGSRWPLRLGLGARRQTIETEAGSAQYIEVGNGPPVVLLHGLDGSSRWWAPTLEALAGHYRCLALEFVRFDHWRERARVPLPRAGEFVIAWLAALGIAQVDLIGHSMGAYTACQVAIDRSDLVGRLTLIAPALLPLPGASLLDLARFAPFIGSVAPGFAPTLVADSLRTGPLRWLRSTLEFTQAQPLPLEQIAAPTLLLWGEHDPLVPVADGEIVQARIPDARLIVLPKSRHVPMFEAPLACNAAINDFLIGKEPTGTPSPTPATTLPGQPYHIPIS